MATSATARSDADDVGRTPVLAMSGPDGFPVPYVPVRVGNEVRDSLAGSGRLLLALEPSQVAHGGRVFVYGKIPDYMASQDFMAEFLVWTEGGWKREKLVEKKAGEFGNVTATLVMADLEPGPVPTAVFARRPDGGSIIASAPVDVPGGARLKVAYTLDEWDWHGLAPVTVSVAAEPIGKDGSTGRQVVLFERRVSPAKQQPEWFDETVDLSSVAGRQVRFLFRAQPDPKAGALEPHVAWAAPTVVEQRRARGYSSVILVSLDGLRARSLSCCGSTRDVSPFIDSLFSEQGVIFDFAVSQGAQSIPSHMSLFTGMYPSVHGVLSPSTSLGENVATLPSVMAESGYATAAFTDGPGLAAELGFGRGFGVYHQDASVGAWSVEGRSADTFARALTWIERHADEPYFVFIHTRQAMPPHVPPRGYLELFKDTPIDSASGLDAGRLVRYDREIRYLNDVFERFVTNIDRLPDSGRAMLIVTSGHGEEFLEHGALGNGTHLYDESIRVPLLLRGGGLRTARRYAEVVGLIDLAPTLLELIGLPIPHSMQGKSIAKALKSGLPYSVPPRYSEAHGTQRILADDQVTPWQPPAYAVTDGNHKMIMHAPPGGEPTFEAYELVADPEETNDLYSTDPGRPDWMNELEGLLKGYPTACKQVATPTGTAPAIPVAERLRLKAFGYTQ